MGHSGTNGPIQWQHPRHIPKAISRSAQREPIFNTEELKLRNAALFDHVNCTHGQTQLECFRNLTKPRLVNAFWSFSTVLGTEGYVSHHILTPKC
jgi:hypothetical protein